MVDVAGEGRVSARMLERPTWRQTTCPWAGIGAAAPGSDVMLLEARAIGPDQALGGLGWLAAAAVAERAVPFWLVSGRGRLVARPGCGARSRRQLGMPPRAPVGARPRPGAARGSSMRWWARGCQPGVGGPCYGGRSDAAELRRWAQEKAQGWPTARCARRAVPVCLPLPDSLWLMTCPSCRCTRGLRRAWPGSHHGGRGPARTGEEKKTAGPARRRGQILPRCPPHGRRRHAEHRRQRHESGWMWPGHPGDLRRVRHRLGEAGSSAAAASTRPPTGCSPPSTPRATSYPLGRGDGHRAPGTRSGTDLIHDHPAHGGAPG